MPSVARPSRAPARVLLALVACTGLAPGAPLSGCAGGSFASGARAVAPLQRVVVFPLNVVVSLPTEIEAGVGPVSEELRAHLEARGLEIEPIGLGEARDAWLASAVALRAEVGPDAMSFEGAARTLSRRLAAERRFDALLLPWIGTGSATMKAAGVASWDGIRRRIQLAEVEGERQPAWAFKRFREIFRGAPVPASSLMVALFSGDGEKLCMGAGGLELLADVLVDTEANAVHFAWVPRLELFADRDHLREGIALAMGSCLGPAPRSAG